MFHELTDTESAIVAQHRAGFLAGTQPMPAEACSELGAEPEFSEDGPMEMLAYASVTAAVVIAALVAVLV